MERLEGKVALVTGAAHGQGRSHALRLAREGADIIAIDVCQRAATVGYPLGTAEELRETVALVEREGRRGYAGAADIRDRDALEVIRDATREDFPTLDIVVANAAISGHSSILEYPQERWDEIIDINLTGTFKVIQTFVPRMVDAGNGGSIVLVSSVAGLKAVPFCGAYMASKWGVQALMRVLALELGRHDIRVNTINPGAVAAPMTEDKSLLALFEDDDADSALFNASYLPVLPSPAGGFLQPEDVSALVAWLVSDEARYITGAAIPFESGALAR